MEFITRRVRHLAMLCIVLGVTQAVAILSPQSLETSNTTNESTSNNSSPGAPEDPTVNRLSRGSAFMLITTLALALVFQPFSGSLIYGPTSRFWLMAPTSLILELIYIWTRLLEYFADTFGWRWPYDTATGTSKDFTFRNAAYALVAARMLNGQDEESREAILNANDAEAVSDLGRSAVRKIHEGLRLRMGFTLPIIAQFTKILVVSGPGTILLKVLGCLLVSHWLTLEFLCLVGKPGNHEDMATRIEELLFVSRKRISTRSEGPGEKYSGKYDIFEPVLFQIHIWSLLAGSLLLIFSGWMENSWAIMVMWMVCFRWVLAGRCLLRTEYNKRKSKQIQQQWKTNNARMSAMLTGLEYGGRNLGGDVGTIFFLSWILFCVMVFDGQDTTRPDWPWLDWLG